LYELDPESVEELDHLCETLGSKAEQLKRAVGRVCADPSGQRNPRHSFTKKFRSPWNYAAGAKKDDVTEFTTNQWRGLFRLLEDENDGKPVRMLAFLAIKGRRFFTVKDCPWHK